MVLRQSDGLANPYLAFSAMLLAGLDGLKRRIDPGPPGDRSPSRRRRPPAPSRPPCLGISAGPWRPSPTTGITSLPGGVFPTELLEDWIALKRRELEELEEHPHPHEFSFYPQA